MGLTRSLLFPGIRTTLAIYALVQGSRLAELVLILILIGRLLDNGRVLWDFSGGEVKFCSSGGWLDEEIVDVSCAHRWFVVGFVMLKFDFFVAIMLIGLLSVLVILSEFGFTLLQNDCI